MTASAMSAFTWNAAVPAGQYAEPSEPAMVRQGNAAPLRPSWAARARAAGRVFWRQRSASATAPGEV
jgi:hypothetical protein